MRIFILGSGRNGSMTIARACRHITNYTSGHETLTKKYGESRFNYPDHHIESDNRLSWFLGRLDLLFGGDAIYIHMKRNRGQVAKSHMSRFYKNGSIMEAFCEGLHLTPTATLNRETRLEACHNYIDTVDENIDMFLKNKSHKLIINLENIEDDFVKFWNLIGAEGDLQKALKELKTQHNKTKTVKLVDIFNRYKWSILYEIKYLSQSFKSLIKG